MSGGGLCPGGSLSGGSLSEGVSVRETPLPPFLFLLQLNKVMQIHIILRSKAMIV